MGDMTPIGDIRQATASSDLRAAARDVRRSRGYTQKMVADYTGVTRKWVSDFENGRTDPPVEMTMRLLVMLGIRVRLMMPIQNSIDDGKKPREVIL
jgi:transcriptional regulator with XRE-family HTH domain